MRLLLTALFVATLSTSALCYTDADIDKATTYAAILGRAAACGVATENDSRRVGAWLDRTFSGEMRKVQLVIFMEGMKMNAQNQAEGKTGDTCEGVKRAYRGINWP